MISSDGYAAIQIFMPGEVQSTHRLLAPPYRVEQLHTGLDADNRLEVRITGSHFAFVVNDAVIGQVDDMTLSSGSLGFISLYKNRVDTDQGVTNPAQRFTGHVVFTNFKLTAPLFGG